MKTHQDKLHPIAGLTLIEVLISVIIFSIIMLFGMSFFTFSGSSFGHSERTTFAIALANSEMEQLKARPWAGLPGAGTTVTAVPDSNSGITYRVTRVVTDIPPAPATPTHKQLHISVDWPGRKSVIDLVTIRAEE